MMKRNIYATICAALVLACSQAVHASELRETPLVRAIERAKTSIVNIHTEKTAPADSLFPGGKGRRVNGMGTGVVVDERGYIVTNYHVIMDVDVLRCTLLDGSSYDAKVISYDRAQDLAIIKVDSSRPLDIMPLGTSSDLRLGETVIAVGNAFGYEHTVTSGIVSALSRDVEVTEAQSYKNLIQTDASINPGNSGGPLLNLDGEVVGINVAIRAGAQRIGFAIPIDSARRTIARLLSVEQLNNTYHGIVSQDLKSADSQMLIVDSARPGSPAATAGFRSGDVIVKAGKIAVHDGADLERALLGHRPGEPVEITVRRHDHVETLAISLAPQGIASSNSVPVTTVARANNDTKRDKIWQVLGLQMIPVTKSQLPPLPPKYDYDGGMQVVEVRAGSPAAASGIRSGDVLVGLHSWQTVSQENVTWILNNPQLAGMGSLKFWVLRGREWYSGDLRLASGGN